MISAKIGNTRRVRGRFARLMVVCYSQSVVDTLLLARARAFEASSFIKVTGEGGVRMRKHVLLGLVVVAFLAMTSVALAGGYATWVPGGPNGTSPHTDYSDSTTKCKVCHAVHNASGVADSTLLRDSRANACVYCHLNPGDVSSLNPYGKGSGAESNYTDDTKDNATDTGWYNHSSTHDGNYATYLGCTSCHSVHGANTFNGGVYILKNNPGLNGGGAIGSAVTNQRDFCRDCHNKDGLNDDVGGCFETCHVGDAESGEGNISPDYYTAARNGVTHVMTSTLTGNGGGQVAWVMSNQCYDCHAAGDPAGGPPYTIGNSFPHYTTSAVQFLSTDYDEANTGMDSVCLNCHTENGNSGGTYTTGVGKTF